MSVLMNVPAQSLSVSPIGLLLGSTMQEPRSRPMHRRRRCAPRATPFSSGEFGDATSGPVTRVVQRPTIISGPRIEMLSIRGVSAAGGRRAPLEPGRGEIVRSRGNSAETTDSALATSVTNRGLAPTHTL